jgi:hypothetical protein
MLQGEFERVECRVEHLLCFPWQNASFSCIAVCWKGVSVT